MGFFLRLLSDPAAITDRQAQGLAKALTQAFREGGNILKARGRAAIGAGGFSGRWQNAFRVNVYPKSGYSGSPRIFGYHKIKYAGQFEDPEPVAGAPYDWLPIEKNLPGGTHWSPAKYTKTIGPLRGGRGGARPILFGQVAVNRAGHALKRVRKGGAVRKAWLPLFVGVPTVNDPKRFDLGAEAERTAQEIGGMFSKVLDV